MQWHGGANVFSELFETKVKPDGTIYQTSYIYLISQYLSNKRYFKLGSGSRTMKRMNDANTMPIPGEGASKSHRVHFLFFWPLSPYKREYGEMIEVEAHKVLRDQFPSYNIQFATGNPSEWYLPKSQQAFFDYVLGMIAVQRPPVDVAYRFDAKKRTNITRTLKATRKFQQFAIDHDKILKQIKITKIARGREKQKTRGNSQYYRDALVGETFRDEGRQWEITDVAYTQGLDRYIVEYRPARLTKASSDQDRAGYDSRLEEVLEWIGPARVRQLGLESNQEYWETLRGSGADRSVPNKIPTMMIRIGSDGAPADINYFDETTGSEVHARMMPHLLHEARAARMPVVMPLNIQGANGDLHCRSKGHLSPRRTTATPPTTHFPLIKTRAPRGALGHITTDIRIN